MDNQERVLRDMVKASEGAPLSPAVPQFAGLIKNDMVLKQAGDAGIRPHQLQTYAALLLQGVQWVKEAFPSQQGPKFVALGNRGGIISVDGINQRVEQICLARPNKSDAPHFIIIPYEEIAKYMLEYQQNVLSKFEAKARASLGEHTAEETIFLTGVEEAYHAVQNQDPVLRQRYETLEKSPSSQSANFTITSLDSVADQSVHDTSPRELDVVPVLQRALDEFRKRKQDVSSSVKSV